MLPANPLQHVLMMDCQRALVMTSGNLSGRPPAITCQQALDELGDIADGFLLHNRDILQRMDDSVVDQDGMMLRRALVLCRMPSRCPPVSALSRRWCAPVLI